LIEKPSDSSLSKEIKKILVIDLKHHYDDIMSLINTACFCDPRIKSLVFMADSDKSCTIASVKEALNKYRTMIASALILDQIS